MAKNVNVSVSLKDVRGDEYRLIKRFMKKVKKERIVEDYLSRRFYEKPSQRRRREKARKLRNAKKAEQKRNQNFNIK